MRWLMMSHLIRIYTVCNSVLNFDRHPRLQQCTRPISKMEKSCVGNWKGKSQSIIGKVKPIDYRINNRTSHNWDSVELQELQLHRKTRHLIRVCIVYSNCRKIRVKRNCLKFPFGTILPAYSQRQATHQCCQYFNVF